jgi:hypothetical protein
VRIKQNGRRRELFFFEWRRLTSSPSSPPTQNLEKILQLKPPSLNQCPTTKRRCWNSISFLSLLWWGAQSIPWLVELRTIAVMLSSPQFIRKFVFKKEIKHFLLRRLMFIQSIYWTLLVVCRFRKNCVFFFSTFFLSLFKEMKNSASHNNKTKTKKQKKNGGGRRIRCTPQSDFPIFPAVTSRPEVSPSWWYQKNIHTHKRMKFFIK